MRNLADNAARHSRGRVAIGVTPAEGYVFVTVEDDGPGVPVEERERIFERFVRLDDIALSEVRRLRAAGFEADGTGIHAAQVHADPRLLGQLVRNLADNAARHSRGRVAIGVSPRQTGSAHQLALPVRPVVRSPRPPSPRPPVRAQLRRFEPTRRG
nr:ATP-binding protein [Microbacterium barkeri]